MLQRLLVALSACAALAVLVVLIGKTQAEPQSLPAHLARINAIESLSTADAQLDVEMARARLSLESEVSTVAGAIDNVQAARTALSKAAAGAPAVTSIVADAFQQVDTNGTARLKAASDSRVLMRQFSADYAKLRSAAEAALADTAAADEEQTRRSITGLVEEITRYSVQSAATNEPAIRAAIDAITAKGNSVGLAAASRDRLIELAQAGTKAFADRKMVRAAGSDFSAASLAPVLDRLRTLYYDQYARQEATLSRYRLVLAVYAAALLVVFGVFGWRLQRSYRELDKSHEELRVLNTSLESTVSSRTAELRKALQDIRMQQAHLIQSEKMAALGQMVAGVAHEINTPLGYVRGNVETVRESIPRILTVFEACQACIASPSDETRANLGAALQAWDPAEGLMEAEVLLGDADHGLGQIDELVKSLKNFSRLDRSFDERFDVNEGIDASLKICQNQLKNRITVNRDYAQLPEIPCAPSQLNQVFLNLLTNAGQAIEGDGIIHIATRDKGPNVEIEIRDSGCGMDETTQAHIFEPFFTTKGVGKGTGLGLSIVYRIIEDHRGTIGVKSAPGKGATFTITLPKDAAPQKAANAPSRNVDLEAAAA